MSINLKWKSSQRGNSKEILFLPMFTLLWKLPLSFGSKMHLYLRSQRYEVNQNCQFRSNRCNFCVNHYSRAISFSRTRRWSREERSFFTTFARDNFSVIPLNLLATKRSKVDEVCRRAHKLRFIRLREDNIVFTAARDNASQTWLLPRQPGPISWILQMEPAIFFPWRRESRLNDQWTLRRKKPRDPPERSATR